MKIVEHASPVALWAIAESLLCAEPAHNTLQLGGLRRMIDEGVQRDERFFSIEHDGALVGRAVWLSSQTLFLSRMPQEAARTLARYLHGSPKPLTGAVGCNDVIDAFVEVYGRATSVQAELMLYQLLGAPDFGRAPGRARIATSADLMLAAMLQAGFEDEIYATTDPIPVEERVAKRIATQDVLLWDVEGKVVSVANIKPLPANTARIDSVYTRPAMRGRGYAQAVTAAASLHAQRSGPRTLFLFADAGNPASNKAYQRIGYVHLGNHRHLLFV